MQDGFQWNMMTGGSQGGSHRYITYPECKMVFSGTWLPEVLGDIQLVLENSRTSNFQSDDHPTLVFYPMQAEKLANIRLGGVSNPNVLVVHKWALDKTQCNCPNCAILEVWLVMSYILHALPIQNFFSKLPSPTHTKWTHSLGQLNICPPPLFIKQSLGFIVAN